MQEIFPMICRQNIRRFAGDFSGDLQNLAKRNLFARMNPEKEALVCILQSDDYMHLLFDFSYVLIADLICLGCA